MAKEKYIVEVEPGKPANDGKPSIGPVYRSVFAKDGFPAPTPRLDSCWDIFRFDYVVFEIVDPKIMMFFVRVVDDDACLCLNWRTDSEVEVNVPDLFFFL